MFKNNTYLGTSTFNHTKRNAVISNLYILPEFRGNKIGSKLLLDTEKIIVNKYNANKFSLLAHELQNGNLVNFYENHGYTVDITKEQNFYDDGIDIYTLVPMYKYIQEDFLV